MWSSWIPLFSTKLKNAAEESGVRRTANLEKRITNLLGSSQPLEKECSPMLKELQNRRNKVKDIRSRYEDNIAAFNEHNASVVIQKPRQKDLISASFVGTKEIDEILLDAPSENSSTWKTLIAQFIVMDSKYIDDMERMIEHFIEAFDNLPSLRLKNEAAVSNRLKQEIFGPIELIYKFHKFTFHPTLLACRHDLQLFASSISRLCNEGDFNSYIVFAMEQQVS